MVDQQDYQVDPVGQTDFEHVGRASFKEEKGISTPLYTFSEITHKQTMITHTSATAKATIITASAIAKLAATTNRLSPDTGIFLSLV